MQLNRLVLVLACAAEAVIAEALRPMGSSMSMGSISTGTMSHTSAETTPTHKATPELSFGQSARSYKNKIERRRTLDKLLKKEDRVVTPGCGKVFVPQYYRRQCLEGIDCGQNSPSTNDPTAATDSMGPMTTLKQKIKPTIASKFEITSSTISSPIRIRPSPNAPKYPSFLHEL